jgi:hypothetical protein
MVLPKFVTIPLFQHCCRPFGRRPDPKTRNEYNTIESTLKEDKKEKKYDLNAKLKVLWEHAIPFGMVQQGMTGLNVSHSEWMGLYLSVLL